MLSLRNLLWACEVSSMEYLIDRYYLQKFRFCVVFHTSLGVRVIDTYLGNGQVDFRESCLATIYETCLV